MARVHRIGSRRTIQELLLVTKESIEERILKLHETKRNVLDNIWSKDGEDTIAAPGGSGAFQQMLKALLDKQSLIAEPTPAHPTEAETTPTGEAAGAVGAAEPVAAAASSLSQAAEAGSLYVAGSGRPSTPVGPEPAVQVQAVAIDPAAIAAAVAAVAPSLPADHRQSLALVFRALANALEQT
jgi:hypothetical protein